MLALQVSALANLVGHVVGMGSKEQVSGIDAAGIIAAVKNMKPIGYLPTMYLVRNTVREYARHVLAYASVAVDIFVAKPLPAGTIIRKGNLTEKAFFKSSESNDVGALTATRRNGTSFGRAGSERKDGSANGTNTAYVSRMGVHSDRLLHRLVGVPCRRMLPTSRRLCVAPIIPHSCGIGGTL